MSLEQEISKRRTFGIISHPDAGKTTLTEKLLLFGGAIQTAGAVKSNKIKKTATSDFMEIEKQRGISVATSVMAFNYKTVKINILDTPGHKDFAEDTYRTLTAVDSVILVIDCTNGVEAQTKKLMEVAGPVKTREFLFLGDPFPATRMFDMGLIARVAAPEDFEAEAQKVIDRLAANAPLSLKAMKALLVRQMCFRDGVYHKDVDKLVALASSSEDGREGTAARLEKRVPVFKGK